MCPSTLRSHGAAGRRSCRRASHARRDRVMTGARRSIGSWPVIGRVMAPAAFWMGHVTGASVRLAQRQPVMRIVMIHGVGGWEIPRRALVEQLEVLKRHFRVIPLHELAQKVRDGVAPNQDVALTFDDGVKNHITEAYPALRALSLPATFFVCPAAIEEGQWIW